MNIASLRLAAIAVFSGVALLLLRGASLAPLHDARSEQAWVRLSWSARPERVEHCRRLTDEELEARPVHMRLRLECEGAFARYALHLTVDGTVAFTDTIRGGGLRHDRPMHVLREVPLAPGFRRLSARLVRLDSVATPVGASERGAMAESDTVLGEREARERDERRRGEGEGIPPALSLDTSVTLGAGRVLLITYDGARRTLIARTGGN